MFGFLEKFYFDREDHDLLEIVDNVVSRSGERKKLKNLLVSYQHPRGIKELGAPRELRIAYAMASLLDSLETGRVDDRLRSLRALRTELLFGSGGGMRMNGSRALLEIMKRLVVSKDGDETERLKLAHIFRQAASGRPRAVRYALRRHHLLEMPEEWNQISFDHHVHDASTKGRKTPSHLVMDAWIKGIRSLMVIYYNFVDPEVARELLEAAAVFGVEVRVGIEVPAKFRGKTVNMIWSPRGFLDSKRFLDYLGDDSMRQLFAEGSEIVEHRRRHILDTLHVFNQKFLKKLNEDIGVELRRLDADEFEKSVEGRHLAMIHLGEFAYMKLRPLLMNKLDGLRRKRGGVNGGQDGGLCREAETALQCDAESLIDNYFNPASVMSSKKDAGKPPPVMERAPSAVAERLRKLFAGYRITLNLSGLSLSDMVEVIHQCRGRITHLEIFNLKDAQLGCDGDNKAMNLFRHALNNGDISALKSMLRGMIAEAEERESKSVDNLRFILKDISSLIGFYAKRPLRVRIGSDSTGRSNRLHGMGMAVVETLPPNARRQLRRNRDDVRRYLPLSPRICERLTLRPAHSPIVWLDKLFALFRGNRLTRGLGMDCLREWVMEEDAADFGGGRGIVALGGINDAIDNDMFLTMDEADAGMGSGALSCRYLNTSLKNWLKVIIGFIPAFLTFFLTKDWWFLAYFGAVVWFSITGARNIFQSILAGQGFRSAGLLKWRDFIYWGRIADSLMYTGFSVPLLDFLVKKTLLRDGFGITVGTSPIALYSIMALVNGIYIAGHNWFRNLPRAAIVGNFFRSALSIPLAIVINMALGGGLGLAGVAAVEGVLQQWAAVISKTASDCMACLIEGCADRYRNLSLRIGDYRAKFARMFRIHAKFELIFPEKRVSELLHSPKQFSRSVKNGQRRLLDETIVNALDLMYFWAYQPRARDAMTILMRGMSDEERDLIMGLQGVLSLDKEISKIFLDGLVGRDFSGALSFYLANHQRYLDELSRLAPAKQGI